MKKIILDKDSVHRGRLILTNKNYPIQGEDFIYPLSEVEYCGGKVYMETRAKRMLTELIAAVRGQGKIVTVSGYRTYEEQKHIYDTSLAENGDVFTGKYVALPNCSEHQTGLAVDLGICKDKIDFIRPDFPNEGVCKRFRHMASRYGYIQRYPQDKEKVTGIGWEPWHFRYVGFPHSEIMVRENLVLEEYVEFLKQYPHGEKSFTYHCGFRTVEISYKEFHEADRAVDIPEQCPFQVSGNNVDGVVVEVWKI